LWFLGGAKKKPPVGPAVVWVRCARLAYALASPAAVRCENQKYAK
jgi:hypothetical protein